MSSWVVSRIAQSDKRVILCVGESDTGKTHFVASLLDELRKRGEGPLHMDLDTGQSTIGPPGAIGLRLPDGGEKLCFVGNTSPLGVVPEILDGLARLKSLVDGMPGNRVLVDSAGLVTGPFGRFLKRMEIETLRPDLAVIIDRCGESRPIARLADRLAVDWLLLSTEEGVTPRSPQERARYRDALFAAYFRGASLLVLPVAGRTLVAAAAPPEPGRLVGLLDEEGFLFCLGLFVDAGDNEIRLLAPRCDRESVRTIKYGRYVWKRS
jgi:polynucleotide 5'-kinase involved in rRNA processing